jgi:ribosomal-protein-alanine N-acetyltransferase
VYINLKTERLNLRPINLVDTRFILELVNSKGWLKFIGDRHVANELDAQQYIQKILDNANAHYTIFELKESSKAIGVVTFLKREDETYPDIGFALLPEFEGKGYTFEACKAYLEKIQASNKYENIIAFTKPDNSKSISLLQRLGLRHTGDQPKGDDILSYYSLK